MKKIQCIIHQNYLDDAIELLHESGLMQIIDLSRKPNDELISGKVNPETPLLLEYENRLSTLIKILKKHQLKNTGLKAILNPSLPEQQLVEETSLEELYSFTESVISPIEKQIHEAQKEFEELKEHIQQLKEYESESAWFLNFDFDLNHIGLSDYVVIKAGKTTTFPLLEQAVAQEDLITIYSQPLKLGKNPEWSVVIIGHISQLKTVERLTAEHIQETILPQIAFTPKKAQQHFQKQIKEAQQKKQKIHKSLQKISAEHLLQLLANKEQIQLERIRKQVPSQLATTEETILLKGWVLEKNVEFLRKKLNDITNDHIIFEARTPSTNPDNPPTHLETPAWAQSFKTLLGLFALPKYNELNPTIMMGIFFIIFFGFMLGDAGYGLIILSLSLFGYLKYGKISPMIKDWGFLGIWLGLATTVVGFLTYSIFGNLLHMMMLGESEGLLYQFSILGVQFPIDSLKDPITILSVALIFGLVQLNVGIIYGLIQTFMRKQYKEMLTEKFCWIPLQIGGGALIGYFILDWSLPEPLFIISGILVTIGIILLLYASGPVGFFDITGYVGDWLSYARLLALGLATAGMALAFNVVSQLLGEMIPFIGIIITIVLLLVLHVVNLAISALGAAVHSLRLQYVEFFNRFYEGGGEEFTPFKIKRTYTKKESEQTN